MAYVSCRLGADFGLVLTEITVASDTPAPFRQVRAIGTWLYILEPCFICTAGFGSLEALRGSALVSPVG